ncbi:hypothetical protein CCAX7_006820 [Capsulimonas corticalis]|uniref:Uncharacterized protein n=1 Tax=Capsulimonas corticalis TaxID=2219043 RepID=A0A402D1I2_9BACT|nr:antitoxin family protein [Capsulimonas corticalis]BDI28631.1 hypothetical protein CCAX7_006820 [Capsulimonas corticalis]
MTTTVEVVYEAGVLRPLAPVTLAEGTHLKVTWTDPEENNYISPEDRAKTSLEILLSIAAMPMETPDDGFSGADHDRILYA